MVWCVLHVASGGTAARAQGTAPAHGATMVTTAADTAQSIVAPTAGRSTALAATPTTGPAAVNAAPTSAMAVGAPPAESPGASPTPLTTSVLSTMDRPVSTGPGLTAATFPLDRVVAVVGGDPILWSSILERINIERAEGMAVPPDSSGQMELARTVVLQLVDEELLLQKAKELKIEVTDEDVAPGVDAQVRRVRAQFPSEAMYRTELKKAGLGTPEEYRRVQMDQAKRAELQRKVIEQLKKDGKLIPVGVSDTDVAAAFEKNRSSFPRRPATVTFRQIIVAPKPTPAAKAAAKAKADSVLAELKRLGADGNIDRFAEIAKRESMDPGTREVGGDLGWNRRGIMVPEFDVWQFGLHPATLSPVIETIFGYHIIRVDRVRPGEVKASHILIRWKIDSAQFLAAKLEADTVLTQWQAGGNVDSLTIKHHDPREEKGALQPFPRDSLPPAYATAFVGHHANEFVGPFAIPDPRDGIIKYVVVQILSLQDGGAYTLADVRGMMRDQLAEERAIRRLLDELRKETYVSVRL